MEIYATSKIFNISIYVYEYQETEENYRFLYSFTNEDNFITCSFDKSINIYRKENDKFILRKKLSNAHNDEIRKVIYCDN